MNKKSIVFLAIALTIAANILGKPKITLSMIVKNEANNYLKEVLSDAKNYIDAAVIIDDASTDNTPQVCQEILNDIPLKLVINKESKFSNEIILRKQQWEETIKTNPEWIVFLDADQLFESKAKDNLTELLNQNHFDVLYFRLYDFWDDKHYREDKFWNAHSIYRPFILRYIPNFNYVWRETAQHCGSFPYSITTLPGLASNLRVKHMGWAKEEDRIHKYKRYMELYEGKYGNTEQYNAVLDENPRLIKWEE